MWRAQTGAMAVAVLQSFAGDVPHPCRVVGVVGVCRWGAGAYSSCRLVWFKEATQSNAALTAQDTNNLIFYNRAPSIHGVDEGGGEGVGSHWTALSHALSSLGCLAGGGARRLSWHAMYSSVCSTASAAGRCRT